MRIFKYKAHIYVPDCENQCNSVDKGLVQVDNDSLSKKDIVKQIHQIKYRSDENISIRIKQILIIE